MAHTPGPWKVSMGSTHVGGPKSGICKFESIHGMYQNHEANARLIAAAPELLEGLKGLLQVIETDQLVPESVSYMQEARKAVAKAEGRSDA